MTAEKIVVFGYGPTGRALIERLVAASRTVTVVQRSRPVDLAAGADFQRVDLLDRDAVLAVTRGASHIAMTAGFVYDRRIWTRDWPIAMANLLAAAEATGAKTVFLDNLYMFGPQDGPIAEETPFAPAKGKPAVRVGVTAQWQEAVRAGRVRFTALRAPDFYGPGVTNSHLGDMAFGALARGRTAVLVAPADRPHDVAYVPDIGRALETLLEAPDDAYGQAWHMPSAPTRTLREILTLGATAIGVKPRVLAIPLGLLPALGLVQPMFGELAELRFTWDRPYRVDGSKFVRRFWSDVTPFEVGAAATARAFAEAAGRALTPSSAS